MKKSIIVALMCMFTSFVFSQNFSDMQINEVISKSAEANKAVGVSNQNLIYPGQHLTFLFMDNTIYPYTVQPGDNQWKIVKNVLALEPIHGKVIDNPSGEAHAGIPDKKDTAGLPPIVPSNGINRELLLIIIGCIALVIIIWFLFNYNVARKFKKYMTELIERNKQQTNNSATDHPMRPNGVPDREAPAYMQTVAIRARATAFGPVRKGRLTTNYPVSVAYANGNRLEKIENEHVFHSKARTAEGTEVDIFYKQVCGNDASVINMEHATFIPDPVQSEELQAANNVSGRQQVIATMNAEASNTGFSGMTNFITALTGPMNGQECGKLKIEGKTGGEFTIEMSFGMRDVTSTQSLKEDVVPVANDALKQ